MSPSSRRYYASLYVSQGLKLLWRNRFWSLLTGVTICLLLFVVYLVVAADARTREAASRVNDQLVVTATINQDSKTYKSTVDAEVVAAQVRRMNEVTNVRVVSEEEARDRFVRNVQDLKSKPPVHVFAEALEIEVSNVDHLETVKTQVSALNGIDRATYLQTLVKKLTSFSGWMKGSAFWLMVSLLLVSTLIIIAVVRSAIHSDRRSVQTMAQVGGSPLGIAAPLLVHLLSVTFVASLIASVAGWLVDPRFSAGAVGGGTELPEWLQTGRSFALLELWPVMLLASCALVAAIVFWSTWRHARKLELD